MGCSSCPVHFNLKVTFPPGQDKVFWESKKKFLSSCSHFLWLVTFTIPETLVWTVNPASSLFCSRTTQLHHQAHQPLVGSLVEVRRELREPISPSTVWVSWSWRSSGVAESPSHPCSILAEVLCFLQSEFKSNYLTQPPKQLHFQTLVLPNFPGKGTMSSFPKHILLKAFPRP